MILLTFTYFYLQYFVLFLFRHIGDVLLNRFLFFGTIVLILLWHLADEVRVLCMFTQDGVKVTGWITSQQDVGTTAGHVGGNGHCSTTSSLRDNLCLTLVMLCIQNIVSYALPVEQL